MQLTEPIFLMLLQQGDPGLLSVYTREYKKGLLLKAIMSDIKSEDFNVDKYPTEYSLLDHDAFYRGSQHFFIQACKNKTWQLV